MSASTDDASGTPLTPPEVLRPLSDDVARTAVPLPCANQAAVGDRVQRFMDGLLSEDLQGDGRDGHVSQQAGRGDGAEQHHLASATGAG